MSLGLSGSLFFSREMDFVGPALSTSELLGEPGEVYESPLADTDAGSDC